MMYENNLWNRYSLQIWQLQNQKITTIRFIFGDKEDWLFEDKSYKEYN